MQNNENFIKNVLHYIPKDCPGFTVNTDYYLKRPDDLYMYEEVDYKNIKDLRTNLIVLPHNLIQQWKHDITTHSDLTYFYISN